MKQKVAFLFVVVIICSVLFIGCTNSNGEINDSSSNVTGNVSSNISSENSETPKPPSVKNVVTEIKNGGNGKSAVDSNSGDEILITPPEFSTSGKVVFNDTGDNSTLLTAKDTTEEEYNTYLQTLEKNGYVKVMDDRKILESDNKSAVYSNGKYIVSTNYIAIKKSAKVAIEPINYDTVEAVNDYLSVFDTAFSAKSNLCEPLLLSLGLSTTENKNETGYYNTGLSYVLRLSDGSFVIIDGGDSVAVNDHAGRIYSVLKNYAPDKNNIRIAAWIITHPHSDHAKAFLEFCGSFLGDKSYNITLERIIANIPNYEDTMSSTVETHLLINKSLRDTFKVCQTRGTKVYKAHTGQLYNLCGATFEMVYTYDISTPDKLAKGMDNTFSVGFMIDFEGKKIFITGDMTSISIKAVNEIYGEKLKCDIVQVPHHGTVSNFKSSSDAEKQARNFEELTKFYTDYTKPSYVLWPSTETGKIYYLSLTVNENPNSIIKTIVPTENIYANGHNVKELSFNTGKIVAKSYDYAQIGY